MRERGRLTATVRASGVRRSGTDTPRPAYWAPLGRAVLRWERRSDGHFPCALPELPKKFKRPHFFSGYADFLALYSKSKFIVLDDCNKFKQHNVLSFIKENSDNFELIYDSENKDVKIFHHLKSK